MTSSSPPPPLLRAYVVYAIIGFLVMAASGIVAQRSDPTPSGVYPEGEAPPPYVAAANDGDNGRADGCMYMGYKKASGWPTEADVVDWSCPAGYHFPKATLEGWSAVEPCVAQHMEQMPDYEITEFQIGVASEEPAELCGCDWNDTWCTVPSIKTFWINDTGDGVDEFQGCGDFPQIHICVPDCQYMGQQYGNEWRDGERCPAGMRLPNDATPQEWAAAEPCVPEGFVADDRYKGIAYAFDENDCNCDWNANWCYQPSIKLMWQGADNGRACGDYAQHFICVSDDDVVDCPDVDVGDINGDGERNVLDVIALVNSILQG